MRSQYQSKTYKWGSIIRKVGLVIQEHFTKNIQSMLIGAWWFVLYEYSRLHYETDSTSSAFGCWFANSINTSLFGISDINFCKQTCKTVEQNFSDKFSVTD